MPIEIKELIIRAQVSEDRRAHGGAPDRAAHGAHGPPARGLSQGEIDRIVGTCVERVLKAIKKSQER